MKHIIFIPTLLLLGLGNMFSQDSKPLTIGINFSPLFIGGADIKADIPIFQSIAIQAGMSGRYQKSQNSAEYPIKSLSNYIHSQNKGLAIQAGLRFADHYAEYYPYASIDAIGSWYYYEYKSSQNLTEISKGFTPGGAISVGFVGQIWKAFYFDIALQTGWSAKLHNGPDNFYLSGMGFNLKGATESPFLEKMTVQPIIMLKYMIKNKTR